MCNVIVVGGGASGLMAACSAAAEGARVTLLEKNEKLGKKLYLTGKGRCNAANLCSREEFIKNVVKNPRFLYSALSALSPEDLVEWFHAHGLETVTERGRRVFPASQKASDVTRCFERELKRLGVDIRLNTQVQSLITDEQGVHGVTTLSGESLPADAVILCTGGCSYPSTGSTGDGWRLLSECGQRLFPPLPALVGLRSEAAWVKGLQGLSLKNVELRLTRGKKCIYSELGEMLFTHFGISGPLVLSASSYMAELDPAEVVLSLNLKPALTQEQLDLRLLREVAAAPKKQVIHLLYSLLPGRLAATMPLLCGLDGEKQAGALTKAEREKVISFLQRLPIPIAAPCSLQEAIITRGGADVKEWNASTLESKLIPGLYIAGELLDVDALTGGYNLQIAFSTGYLAGRNAACPV